MTTLKVHYNPHSDLALEIHKHPARFRVLDCGRRWGKTTLEMAEAVAMSIDVRKKHNRKARGWIVGPTYDLVMEEWRVGCDMLKDVLAKDGIKRHEKKMYLVDGTEIEFKSADSKDTTLRGAGLDWCIIAEASRVSQDAWEQGIRPALADKLGRAVFGSTPKGKNYFYDLYRRGQDNQDKDWKSWKLPSITNPYFPKEEFYSLQKSMPEMLFKQEMEAEFIDDSGVVFRGIKEIVCGDYKDAIDGHDYIIGVDLAKTHDFTVIHVMDRQTKEIVYFDRFNQMDWPYQKEKINWIAKKYYEAQIWIDSTGLGDPIENDLRKDGRRIFGYKFSNSSKKELIEFLCIAIQQRMFTMPENETVLTELAQYDYELLPGGSVRYSAPVGKFDDCVISLALCVHGMKQFLYQIPETKKKNPWDGLDMRSRIFWENQKKSKEKEKNDDDLLSQDSNFIEDISIF